MQSDDNDRASFTPAKGSLLPLNKIEYNTAAGGARGGKCEGFNSVQAGHLQLVCIQCIMERVLVLWVGGSSFRICFLLPFCANNCHSLSCLALFLLTLRFDANKGEM